MRKIAFVLTTFIYVTAIVVVAFVGILAEVRNATVEVTAIVLEEARFLAPGRYLTYPDIAPVESSIYAIFARPDSSSEEQSEYDITWNVGGVAFDYVIQIRGYTTIMESDTWKDGKGNLRLSAFVKPENATIQDLNYSLVGVEEDMTISQSGILTFQEKRTGIFAFDVQIKAQDTSYKVSNIHIIAVGY